MNEKYNNLTLEQALSLLDKYDKELKRKEYGLVWDSEKEPEKVVEDCKKFLPVLKEDKSKHITTGQEQDNILIEGDNYHALQVLSYTHRGKIDVIYIDPPYNTGNKDFVYNDRFVDKEDGYRHSKWLNFMEKRLDLARDLLTEEGVIFISIDDNEQANLKLLCDKIFGEGNFVSQIIWRKKRGGGRGNSIVIPQTEYILVYALNINNLAPFEKELSEHKITKYKFEDSFGKYAKEGLDHHSPQGAYERKTLQYELVIDGKQIYCPTGQWLWSKERVKSELENYKINSAGEKEYKYLDIVLDTNNRWRAFKKMRLNDDGADRMETVLSIIDDPKMTTNTSASEIKELFGEAVFNYSKPLSLVKHLTSISSKSNSIILDFMAGSGTTGHAVLELNKEDGGSRKFILCTNNELNGVGSELVNQSPKEDKEQFGICQRVTYPRISKVIKGYNKNGDGEFIEGLGGNLRYFKTDFIKNSSNEEQLKINLTKRCTEILALKEGIFNEVKSNEDFAILKSNTEDKHLCIYYNFINESFDKFLLELQNIKSDKVAYVFSLDDAIDDRLFSGIHNLRIEPVPAKILTQYRKIMRKHLNILL